MIINLYEFVNSPANPILISIDGKEYVVEGLYKARIAGRKLSADYEDVSISTENYYIDYYPIEEIFSNNIKFERAWFWNYPSVEIVYHDYQSLRN
jgi:hypothetical protein